MKQFRFRLEGLLRMRKVEEDRCVGILRAHQGAVADAVQRREQITAERDRTIDALRRLEQGMLEMEEILRHRRYLITLDNRGREIDAEIIRRRTELIEAQRVAERAIRERQLVERLRERRKEEHRLSSRRQEVRDLDEVAAGSRIGKGAEI